MNARKIQVSLCGRYAKTAWRSATVEVPDDLDIDDLSDEDIAEFADGIRTIISQILDEYFRDEFEPDEV